MSAWQPIETAPKDGTRIMAYIARIEHTLIIYWEPDTDSEPHWSDEEGFEWTDLTHWMPLPDPPRAQDEKA